MIDTIEDVMEKKRASARRDAMVLRTRLVREQQLTELDRLLNRHTARLLHDVGNVPPAFEKTIKRELRLFKEDVWGQVIIGEGRPHEETENRGNR